MQITPYEIADCWTEEEIIKFRKESLEALEILNAALDIKIQRMQNLKLDMQKNIFNN